MSHQHKPLHILSFTFYTPQSRYHHSSIHPISYINYSWYITLRDTTTPPWFSHLLSPSFQVTCSTCHVQHSLSLTVELKKKVGRFWKKSHLHNNFLWKALFHRIFLQFLSDEKTGSLTKRVYKRSCPQISCVENCAKPWRKNFSAIFTIIHTYLELRNFSFFVNNLYWLLKYLFQIKRKLIFHMTYYQYIS